MDDLAYVATGYAVTVGAVAAYAAWLARRGRRARASARALTAERRRAS